mgnify:FL=1
MDPSSDFPFSCLNYDCSLEIFSYLNVEDALNLRLVSKEWKNRAEEENGGKSILEKINVVRAHLFGKERWLYETGLKLKEPYLPWQYAYELLNASCPFWEGRKIYQTHTLVMMVPNISLEEFEDQIFPNVNRDPKPFYREFSPHFAEIIKEKQLDEASWVLFTNQLIEGTQGKSISDQELVLKKYIEYRAPTIVEAVICIFARYVMEGECEFGVKPLTYVRCAEVIKDWPVCIGGFEKGGLEISGSFYFGAGHEGIAPIKPIV